MCLSKPKSPEIIVQPAPVVTPAPTSEPAPTPATVPTPTSTPTSVSPQSVRSQQRSNIMSTTKGFRSTIRTSPAGVLYNDRSSTSILTPKAGGLKRKLGE